MEEEKSCIFEQHKLKDFFFINGNNNGFQKNISRVNS